MKSFLGNFFRHLAIFSGHNAYRSKCLMLRLLGAAKKCRDIGRYYVQNLLYILVHAVRRMRRFIAVNAGQIKKLGCVKFIWCTWNTLTFKIKLKYFLPEIFGWPLYNCVAENHDGIFKALPTYRKHLSINPSIQVSVYCYIDTRSKQSHIKFVRIKISLWFHWNRPSIIKAIRFT